MKIVANDGASLSPGKQLQAILAIAFTGLLLLTSILVLGGWVFDIHALTHIIDSFPSMKFNTASGFLLLAIAAMSLWDHRTEGLAWICALILASLFAMTLAEYALDITLPLDNWLVTDTHSPFYPGRPSIGTSICFLIAASALIIRPLKLNNMPLKLDILMAAGLCFPLIALLGYIFTPEGLFAFKPTSTMAVHTTIGFFLFWGSFSLTHRNSYLIQLLFDDHTPGGKQVQRLILPVIAAPLVIGFCYNLLVSHHLLDPILALAIFATNFVIFALAALIRNAIVQNRWFADLHTITDDNLETKLQLAIVMDSAMGAIFLISQQGDVISVNRGATKLLGWRYEELQQMNVMQLVPVRVRRRLIKSVIRFNQQIDRNHASHVPLRLIALRKDGTELAIQVSVTRHIFHGRWVYGALIQDTQSLVDHISQLSRDIHVDPLTLCYNRRALDQELKKLRDFGLREGQKFAIMMIDIDHFKEINDQYGHEAGDIVIKTFARRIKHSLRYHDRLYRYGGDEFVIIAEASEFSHVLRLANRIRHTIVNEPVHYQDVRVPVTTSIGICSINGGGDLVDICMRGADQALYKAKQMGRDRIEVYSELPFAEQPRPETAKSRSKKPLS